MRRAGMTYKAIASAMGVSIPVVSRVFNPRNTYIPGMPRKALVERRCMCCGKAFRTREDYRLCDSCRAKAAAAPPWAI